MPRGAAAPSRAGWAHQPPSVSDNAEVRLRSGAALSCLVCGGHESRASGGELNASRMSFLGIDWANRSSDGAICQACGLVHAFLDGDLACRAP